MIGKFSVACVSLLAVLAFLLLFGSGSHVNAVTYKMTYHTELSCNGPDLLYGTVDDSCVEDVTYGAYGAGLNADLKSMFAVPTADPKYSQYGLLATMGTPSTWNIAIGEELPDGTYVGNVNAISTLGLFGGYCTTTTPVLIPLQDCSTDITDTIAWDEAESGRNLTYGHEGGLPAGCRQYPAHLLDIIGNIEPRARYYGFTIAASGMPPTQLNFLMFNPEQLTSESAPKADFGDDMGYINFTVLDNPNIPSASDSALDEFCTPLATTTTLFGVTGGESKLSQEVKLGSVPTAVGTFWTFPKVTATTCVQGDCCGDGVDNDGNTRTDEMCGIVRITNPAAGTGVYGTGSHAAGGYSESYRDADGDTIPNNQDECPFNPDNGVDTETTPAPCTVEVPGDHIDSICDPNPAVCNPDEDGDGWRNQADNCPLVFQTSQANDADGDNIGDACDTVGAGGIGQGPNTPDGEYLNDFVWGSICIAANDTDDDGWCDATEDIDPPGAPVETLSDKNDVDSVPEYTGLDFVVNAEENPPGAAPQSCSNYDYYDVNSVLQNSGVLPMIDDDGDTLFNASDPNCAVIANDTDQDGVVDGSDNCINDPNPTQIDRDQDGTGDACDLDDDNDGINDTIEWTGGSDPKNVCSPRNFDLKVDGVIDILDVVVFRGPLSWLGQPCSPPADYSICEATYRSDSSP